MKNLLYLTAIILLGILTAANKNATATTMQNALVTDDNNNTPKKIAGGVTGPLTWKLTSDSVLTISGTGAMPDYDYECTNVRSPAPWMNHCLTIKALIIEQGVTSIGDYAFTYCSDLMSVTIPNSVTSIGYAAFGNCSGLNEISVAIDNPNYASDGGVVFTKQKDTMVLYPKGKTGGYSIPNSVTSIGDHAFLYCSGLMNITIPNGVTSIGDYTFYGCSGLMSVTIPNSVTTIGYAAFSGCSGLTSVTIPNSVTKIENYAFDNCSNLQTVNFNATNCFSMGGFYNYTKLTTLNIGNNVTNIPRHAFSGCRSLTSVTIGNRVAEIGEGAFSDCDGLTSVTIMATTPPRLRDHLDSFTSNTNDVLYVPAGCVNAYKAAGWNSVFTTITEQPH